jgi:hypothetical protein
MGPRRRPPRGDQTWRTFVRNHARELGACDFLSQYTATFAVAYVFVIIEIASRRIAQANVTTTPTLPWVQQQVREATPAGTTPRFLVHDNDAIYGQYRPPVSRIEGDGRTRRYRCHLDRWLHEVMGIQGIPIPYGAPNASPHVERFMRTLRQEALDHFLLLTVAHLRRVVHTYVAYYNGARPSQGSTRSLRRTRNSGPRHPPRARSSPCPSSAASITTTGSQRSAPTIPAKVHRHPDRCARRPLIGCRPGDLAPEKPWTQVGAAAPGTRLRSIGYTNLQSR